ncbi:MAG: hypothetical protein ACUVQP_08820 [Bacteroidales bacterium]
MKIYKIDRPGADVRELTWELKRPFLILGGERLRRKIPIVGEGPEVRIYSIPSGLILVRGEYNDSLYRCLCIVNTVGNYGIPWQWGLYNLKNAEFLMSGMKEYGNGVEGEEALIVISQNGEFELEIEIGKFCYYSYYGENGWVIESEKKHRERLKSQEYKEYKSFLE